MGFNLTDVRQFAHKVSTDTLDWFRDGRFRYYNDSRNWMTEDEEVHVHPVAEEDYWLYVVCPLCWRFHAHRKRDILEGNGWVKPPCPARKRRLPFDIKKNLYFIEGWEDMRIPRDLMKYKT